MKKLLGLLLFAVVATAGADVGKKKDPCADCKKQVLAIFNSCFAAAKTPDDQAACAKQYEVMGKSCIEVQCKGKTDLAPAPIPKPAGAK